MHGNMRAVGVKSLYLLALILFCLSNHQVHADVNSCLAAVSPSPVAAGRNNNFTITVTNSSANSIQFVSILVPANDFFFTDGSAPGWVAGNPGDGSGVVLSGGNINPGDSADFSVSANTAIANVSAVNWQVNASDDPDGANPTSCSGNLGTAINGHAPNGSDAGVSNIVLSNLNSNSVTVTWDSDLNTTGLVYYGKSANYGSWSNHYTNPASSHTVNLIGLSANTTYHFQVAGQDDSLNAYYSADNTFVTLPGAQSPSSSFVSTPVPIKAKPTEKQPPLVSLSTVIKNPYKQSPEFNGVATDNEAVAGIEYSTDGGKNWLPIEATTGLGSKNATFSFTPRNLDDGNFKLALRAIDTSGNTAQTSPQTLVIDRLPPIVGGNVVSIGPQIINPDKSGAINTLAGVDERITVSVVGGPISIILTAHDQSKLAQPQTFRLNRSQDSGLWSGIISFKKVGSYRLTASSVDGAGNKTNRTINTINVLSASKIIKAGDPKSIKSQITVYYLDSQTGSWVVWDGSAYGQANPQVTDNQGQFSLILPAGEYYLKANSDGNGKRTSDIFKLNQPTPISTIFTINNSGFNRLAWLNFSTQKLQLTINHSSAKSPILGKALADIQLTDSNGGQVYSANWLGKPTLLCVMSTWSPNAASQLGYLEQLRTNPYINVIPVGLQESAGKLHAYSAIAGNKLVWLADPDSTFTNNLGTNNLPTNYFVDRQGVIKIVNSGIMSKHEIQEYLSRL